MTGVMVLTDPLSGTSDWINRGIDGVVRSVQALVSGLFFAEGDGAESDGGDGFGGGNLGEDLNSFIDKGGSEPEAPETKPDDPPPAQDETPKSDDEDAPATDDKSEADEDASESDEGDKDVEGDSDGDSEEDSGSDDSDEDKDESEEETKEADAEGFDSEDGKQSFEDFKGIIRVARTDGAEAAVRAFAEAIGGGVPEDIFAPPPEDIGPAPVPLDMDAEVAASLKKLGYADEDIVKIDDSETIDPKDLFLAKLQAKDVVRDRNEEIATHTAKGAASRDNATQRNAEFEIKCVDSVKAAGFGKSGLKLTNKDDDPVLDIAKDLTVVYARKHNLSPQDAAKRATDRMGLVFNNNTVKAAVAARKKTPKVSGPSRSRATQKVQESSGPMSNAQQQTDMEDYMEKGRPE